MSPPFTANLFLSADRLLIVKCGAGERKKLSARHQGNGSAEEVRQMRKKEARICVKIESLEVRADLTCWRCQGDPGSMKPKRVKPEYTMQRKRMGAGR